MKKFLSVLLAILISAVGVTCQTSGTYVGIPYGPTLPINCNVVSNSTPVIFFLNSSSTADGPGLYICSARDTWTLPGADSTFFGANLGNDQQVLFNSAGVITGAQGFTYNPNTTVVSTPSTLFIGSPDGSAGGYEMPYGPLPIISANSDGWSAPSMGNPAGILRILPGFPGGGVLQGFAGQGPNGSFYVKYGSSGDTNHSTGRVLGAAASVGNTVVCSFSYCQQGAFKVIVHANSATPCVTPGSGAVQFFVTFTDDVGQKVNQPIPLIVNGGSSPATSMGLGNTTNWAYGETGLYHIPATNISFSTTFTPCTSPTNGGSYNYDIEVREDL